MDKIMTLHGTGEAGKTFAMTMLCYAAAEFTDSTAVLCIQLHNIFNWNSLHKTKNKL